MRYPTISDYSPPFRHSYPSFIMELSISMFTEAMCSFRAIAKVFILFAKYFNIATPTFSQIRRWVFLFGYYQLNRNIEFRSDRIFILDYTLELGKNKCLLILGITKSQLEKEQIILNHKDVSVLHIESMKSSRGEFINERIEQISQRFGSPIQIVSDHGNDIRKGIRLYKNKHPETIHTYDVTHKIAILLKKTFSQDEKFDNLMKQYHKTIKQVQQTELCFLLPKKQRAKSRYANIDFYINWAEYILKYEKKNDFSMISSSYILNKNDLLSLKDVITPEIISSLSSLAGIEFENEFVFKDNLIRSTKGKISDDDMKKIIEKSNYGRNRFFEKFGWLSEYESDISDYVKIIKLARLAKKMVKRKGIIRESPKNFQKEIEKLVLQSERVTNFKEQVLAYLEEESDKIPENETLLGCSDIIESIFGKYKEFSKRSPLREFREMILTIPIFTNSIDSKTVKKAMESCTFKKMQEWVKKTFGQSLFSKRKMVFNTT